MSVVLKIKYVSVQYSLPSGVCVDDSPRGHRYWATEREDSPAVQFISPALCFHMKAMFLYSFLPGRGLSCSYPNPAPGNEQEETPFRSGQQLGACGWEGVGGGARNLYNNPCKEKKGDPGAQLCLLRASVYSRARKKKYDYQQEFVHQRLRLEAQGNGGFLYRILLFPFMFLAFIPHCLRDPSWPHTAPWCPLKPTTRQCIKPGRGSGNEKHWTLGFRNVISIAT